MSLAWLAAKRAWVNTLRAILWYSGSVSTLVSTPPGRMPRSSQMPELPQPVPISTTALAAIAVAKNRNAAPVAGVTGLVPPISSAAMRAVSSGSSSTAYSASSYSMTAPSRRFPGGEPS